MGKVGSRRGVFKGDYLTPLVFVVGLITLSLTLRKAKAANESSESKEKINHLLFMDDLKLLSKSEKELHSYSQSVQVFSEDIGMEFSIERCAILVIKEEWIINTFTIELPDGKAIKSLGEDESYMYLGILDTDKRLVDEMKKKVLKEYFAQLREVLKSKLKDESSDQGVNAWAVSLLRYSVAFISWRKCKLQGI